jgi:hypothetical protein
MALLVTACSGNGPTPASSAAPRTAYATGRTTSPDVRESVRLLTARGSENLEVTAGPLPGSRLIRVRGGYGEVLVAKTSPDGTVSSRCVDSPGGADAFLNDSPSSAPVKAAQ